MTRAPKVPFSITDLLLRGHPDELLPEERDRLFTAARAYITNANHPPSARERVHRVWLQGEYQRAWDPKEQEG